jgi:protein gp37
LLMPGDSSIGWTDATWNVVVGCTRVSAGCLHCYAKTLHDQRHAVYQANGGLWTPGGKRMPPQYAHPFETVQLLPERLNWPLTVRQPKMIFVNSVSDLFHEAVPEAFIRQVFDVMRKASWHIFQILTKRSARLRELGPLLDWPSNVWQGVSIEKNRWRVRGDDLRIGAARAAVRFYSLEPLLSALPDLDLTTIDWVIVGSESGGNARPMDEAWVRQIRDRCVAQRIPFFYKQRTIIDAKGYGRKVELPLLDGVQWAQFPPGRAA